MKYVERKIQCKLGYQPLFEIEKCTYIHVFLASGRTACVLDEAKDKLLQNLHVIIDEQKKKMTGEQNLWKIIVTKNVHVTI